MNFGIWKGCDLEVYFMQAEFSLLQLLWGYGVFFRHLFCACTKKSVFAALGQRFILPC
jgi:hypothetical protein